MYVCGWTVLFGEGKGCWTGGERLWRSELVDMEVHREFYSCIRRGMKRRELGLFQFLLSCWLTRWRRLSMSEN